jgi:ABC-type glycerol-3-phosphate transport system permease component
VDRYGLVWNFTEPFFVIPFLTGYGAWVFEGQQSIEPALGGRESVAAYKFVLSLRDQHAVLPANCDYEMADTLFKTGKAAMIINGDWSWSDYLAQAGIHVAIAPLPVVSETGLPMAPMVATKGYSLNANASPEAAAAAMEFVRFATSQEVQRKLTTRLKTLPSRLALLDDPSIEADDTLRASAEQMRRSRPMPVVAELRAIWDSMRPHYQALLGGSVTAEQATADMQVEAQTKIRQMNQQFQPTAVSRLYPPVTVLLCLAVLFWQRHGLVQFWRDWRKNRIVYIFITPALLVIAATVVFLFLYNIVISLSNMSLRNFRDWQVTGLQNYLEVLREASFLPVLGKTVVWTTVSVTFHVCLGLLLAVALNSPVAGKAIYRVLLIIPWAVPAYITALTWRGMFDYEFGAVNLMISKYLSLPMVNWLGAPLEAFLACIVTNVWLGFPFMMIIGLGGMQGIPRELYEAARIDGISRWGQFVHITLPLLKPVLNVLSISLRPGDRLRSTDLSIIPADWSLHSYVALFTEQPFLTWLGNSLLVSTLVTLTGVTLASTGGYAFSRFRFVGRDASLLAILTTQMFPATMLLLPLYILIAKLHLVNTFLGLLIFYTATALPFCLWQMKGFYDTIPVSLEEAARIDGCTRWQAFYRITLPLAAPGLVITALFSFMSAWSEYIVAAQVLQDREMFTLPLGLKSFQATMSTQWGLYAASSILVSLPVVVVFVLLSRNLVSGLTLGSVKE